MPDATQGIYYYEQYISVINPIHMATNYIVIYLESSCSFSKKKNP